MQRRRRVDRALSKGHLTTVKDINRFQRADILKNVRDDIRRTINVQNEIRLLTNREPRRFVREVLEARLEKEKAELLALEGFAGTKELAGTEEARFAGNLLELRQMLPKEAGKTQATRIRSAIYLKKAIIRLYQQAIRELRGIKLVHTAKRK